MAYTRKEEFVLDLSGLVQDALKAFDVQRTQIQSEKEAMFSRRVVEEGMSYEAQLDYREKQLEKEKSKTYPDPTYVSDLKSDVADLKEMVRFQRMRDEYKNAYTDWATGKDSIDNLIGVLEDQIATTSNPDMREELNKQLRQAKSDKANGEMTVLDNRVKLAKADGSLDLINSTIGDLEKRRNKAMIAGDEQTMSYLDVKIQSLESQKTKIQTQDKFIDFDLKANRQNLNAVEKLQMLEDEIASADDTGTININETTWDSAKEFWTYQKSNYLAGTGSGSFKNFFEEHSSEMKTKIAKASARNNYGYVPNSVIQGVENSYNNVSKMSALEGYEDKIETYKLSDVADAIDKSAKAIVTESQDTGSWNAGFEALRTLESMFGLDTSAYVSDLSYKSITTMPSRASAMRSTAEMFAAERGTSVEEEVSNLQEMLGGAQEDEEAPASERAQTPTPTAEPEQKPQQLSQKQKYWEQAASELEQSRPEVAKKIRKKQGITQPQIEETGTSKPEATPEPQKPTYKIESGDSLSSIASQYNSSVGELMELNKDKIKDPNKIYAGDIINIPE